MKLQIGRRPGEGGSSGSTLKESLVFVFCCVPSPSASSQPPPSLPVRPTNQVYQSLKLMNGPRARLFITMRGLSRSAPSPSSVLASPALDFFFFLGLFTVLQEGTSTPLPHPSLRSSMQTSSSPASGCVSPAPSSPLLELPSACQPNYDGPISSAGQVSEATTLQTLFQDAEMAP